MYIPRNETERLIAAIRTNLTGIEIATQVTYPETPDYETASACLKNIAVQWAQLTMETDKQANDARNPSR